MDAIKEFLLLYKRMRKEQRIWNFNKSVQQLAKLKEVQSYIDKYANDLIKIFDNDYHPGTLREKIVDPVQKENTFRNNKKVNGR